MSSQNTRVKGVFSLDNHMENLLGWITSWVSASRARVLDRLRAFLFRELIERSFTVVRLQRISILTQLFEDFLPGLRGFSRIKPSTVSGSSQAKDNCKTRQSYKDNSTMPFITNLQQRRVQTQGLQVYISTCAAALKAKLHTNHKDEDGR